MESAERFVMEFALAEEFLIPDVQLPGLNGLDLQNKLAELGCRLPIVFVTAHGSGETRERAMREGAADFLTKPVRRERVSSVACVQPSGPGANENEETDAG